jgi:hypothetical protein
MASDTVSEPRLYPKQEIRRFDVFAEYQRLKGLQKGLDAPHAKGYGLWVAKVVASGGRKRSGDNGKHAAPGAAEDHIKHDDAPREQVWHELSGTPQTDTLFDREIVTRMGKDFYSVVFAPAIAQAVEQGRSYESIRDAIRKKWKPPRS